MAFMILALVLLQENSARDDDALRRIDRWIEMLNSDDLIQRDEAHTRLGELWKDVRHVLPELEGARASSNAVVRRRSDRIVRSLRESLEITPGHAVRPGFEADDLEAFDVTLRTPIKTVLESYDVRDPLERFGGERFADLLKEVPGGNWDARHTVEVTGRGKLFVVATPEVHLAIRTFLAEFAAVQTPPKREAVGKDVARLGDEKESEQEAAEVRLRLLGRQFKHAREALRRREGAGELDVRARIAGLLRDCENCRTALSGHEERRRAGVARLQAEGESLDATALPEIVQNALEPCVAREVRLHP